MTAKQQIQAKDFLRALTSQTASSLQHQVHNHGYDQVHNHD